MKAAYVTDSSIAREGHGGSVVSYHELNALTRVVGTPQIYQRVGKYFFEEHYQNPFMLDYFYASIVSEPENVELAHFYGANFNLTAKLFSHARKYATVPAHNLELSLDEWGKFGFWQPPPPHLTSDSLFRFLVHGLQNLTVICPSTSSAEYLTKKIGLKNRPVIIPHGTELPAVVEKRPVFNVFHLSSFGPDKGQIYLFKAWSKFIGFKAATLTMVCNGIVEPAVPHIPALNVIGYLPEAEKETWYRQAVVYVQPSVTEGWGLTVGEAMAHSTPVIVTEGVGAKDMVEDGKDGFIVPIRDPDAIAAKLQYFYDNPSEVKRMGQNARRKAEQYSWDFIEKQYEALYEGN